MENIGSIHLESNEYSAMLSEIGVGKFTERFVVFMLLNECLMCGEKEFVDSKNKEKLDEYIDALLYYFKYRECNPWVVELMIESFNMGSCVTQ